MIWLTYNKKYTVVSQTKNSGKWAIIDHVLKFEAISVFEMFELELLNRYIPNSKATTAKTSNKLYKQVLLDATAIGW
jgi:hypothetical protein